MHSSRKAKARVCWISSSASACSRTPWTVAFVLAMAKTNMRIPEMHTIMATTRLNQAWRFSLCQVVFTLCLHVFFAEGLILVSVCAGVWVAPVVDGEELCDVGGPGIWLPDGEKGCEGVLIVGLIFSLYWMILLMDHERKRGKWGIWECGSVKIDARLASRMQNVTKKSKTKLLAIKHWNLPWASCFKVIYQTSNPYCRSW